MRLRLPRRRSSGTAISYEGIAIESAILACVLGEHPQGIVLADLSDAVLAGLPPQAGGEEIERAVRQLVGARMLRIDRGLLLPGPAAVGEEEPDPA